jgi:threonine dehydrogenase-like Zn-dependent dehydrogenase
MVAHKSQLVKIDHTIPDKEAILLEPTACSVRAVLKRPPEKGEKALVIGTGAIGLNIIAVIKAISPETKVYALSRYPHQAEMARRLGAEEIIPERDAYKKVAEITGGRYFSGLFKNEIVIGGFDVIYDSVGNDRTVKDALRWARGEGTVVIVGINFSPKRLDYSPVWFHEINLMGIDCHGMETFRGKRMSSFDIALTLYNEGKLDFTGFVTHVFPMDEYRKAIDIFFHKGKNKAVKIALTHG